MKTSSAKFSVDPVPASCFKLRGDMREENHGGSSTPASRTWALRRGALVAGALMLAACASLPPNPQLQALQARYEVTSSRAFASQVSGDELTAARDALALGSEAYQEGDDDALAHYVFVADKSLDIADDRVAYYETNQAISTASEDRERMIREIREMQLASAEQEVELTSAALASREQQLSRQQQTLTEQQQRLVQTEEELQSTRDELEATRKRAEQLDSQLTEVTTRESERGTILVLSDIVFDFDSASLNEGSTRALDEIAEFLTEQDATQLTIEGHTDALGADDYNMMLSRERAQSVRDALVSRGVDAAAITVAGYGEDYPVASNDTDAGRQLNRRVEIILDDKTGAPEGSGV